MMIMTPNIQNETTDSRHFSAVAVWPDTKPTGLLQRNGDTHVSSTH